MRIDQFLPSLVPDDAIGNHVRNVRDALRQAGYESDIWAEDVHGSLRHEARSYRGYGSSGPPADVVVYHVAHHSPLADFLVSRPEALVVDYHNITPAAFFADWDPRIADGMVQARHELRRLAGRAVLGLADSSYNEQELISTGYARTGVSPCVIDYDRWSVPVAPVGAGGGAPSTKGGSRWIFVGRIAPNKCQHDLVGALAVHRALFDPDATLTLVGGTTSRLYLRALQRLIDELDLGGAVEVTGATSFDELRRRVAGADVVVCLSEHEGFCVPLVEAMAVGVPVVAYAAAAVPETVGEAALLLDDKDPLVVACAVEALRRDPIGRTRLVDRGRERTAQLGQAETAPRFVAHLRHVVAELGAG